MKQFVYLVLITQMAGARPIVVPDQHAQFRAEGRRTSLRQLTNPDHGAGVIGDSGVTGAASSPEISANVFTLLNQVRWFAYQDDKLTGYLPPGAGAVTRVAYAAREFDEARAHDAVVSLNLGARRSVLVDVPEYAFPYRVARAAGVAAPDVVVTAEDGKRVSAIPTQLERLYEMDTATLPPIVFVSFTANDFCDPGVFEEAVSERARRFKASLEDAWDASKPFLRAHPRGTRFVVTAPLEVANVLTNPDILAQEVPIGAYGTVTCQEMRTQDVAYAPLAWLTTRLLANMCPAVLGTRPDDLNRIARLREIQNAFNTVWKNEVARLNQLYAGRGLAWLYLEGTRDIAFTRGDVSAECFHPSAKGHAKIAAYVARALGRDVRLDLSTQLALTDQNSEHQ